MFTGVTRSRGINRIDKICGLNRIAKNSSTHMINDKITLINRISGIIG